LKGVDNLKEVEERDVAIGRAVVVGVVGVVNDDVVGLQKE